MIRKKWLNLNENTPTEPTYTRSQQGFLGIWIVVIISVIIGGIVLDFRTAKSPSHITVTETSTSTPLIESSTTTPREHATQPESTPSSPSPTPATTQGLTWSMKLVNENVTDADLDEIKALGITILSGEWGIDEATPKDMLSLLDRTHARGMKWIINLTEGGAWGYKEDGSDPANQKPSWQHAFIEEYINQIKHHPAIFGYDVSNEAGVNLPNGENYPHTITQMKQASEHIRSLDPTRPILIRMHYWDEYDGPDFGPDNPFEKDITDIVMLNLYSNYTDNRTTPNLPTMIADDGQELVNKILAVDPSVEVWIALGAFQEPPLFLSPSRQNLERDIEASLALTGVTNIGFFGWGPERYPTEKPSYTLSDGLEELKSVISSYSK